MLFKRKMLQLIFTEFKKRIQVGLGFEKPCESEGTQAEQKNSLLPLLIDVFPYTIHCTFLTGVQRCF